MTPLYWISPLVVAWCCQAASKLSLWWPHVALSLNESTHCGLGDFNEILDEYFSRQLQRHGNVFYCSLCLSEIFPYNHLSEEYFDAAITESCEGRPLISFEILKNQELIFSPFDFNDNSNSPLHDIDPDIQFYNDLYSDSLQPCDCYLEEMFNAKVTKEKVGDQHFSMMHLNILSVQKNLGTLESYLATLNHKFTIVGISESWLKDHNADRYGLSGYNAIHKYRSTRAGGGVSIFIQDDIEYFCRDDLCYQNDTIETVFIEIDKDHVGKEKNVIIGVI